MPGRFRTLKWLSACTWLIYLLGPYLRWHGHQAVTFDIAGRKFHIFGITILPQDIWMLAMVMLFFAMLLAAVTSIAGRVYCGYFCFQTVWTDVFTWIEEKLEGNPVKRAKLDQAPWSGRKIRIKLVKYALWTLIALFTGITFTLWFGDAHMLWVQYLTFQAPLIAYGAVAVFTFFTLLFAGHMREQVCFWLCPYARIQGVMADRTTVLPTYDFKRGEPRGKLKKSAAAQPKGDCIDCKLCLAVCPTGIDIRNGQQEGCITCALCLDACDSVMKKINRPTGLIRYTSLDVFEGKPATHLMQRPRVLVYSAILLAALGGILYGLTHLGDMELKILHERRPLFVLLSDGSIQNKYEFKVLNKTDKPMRVQVLLQSPPSTLQLVNADKSYSVAPSSVEAFTIFVKLAAQHASAERTPVRFRVVNQDDPSQQADYTSMFFAPAPL